MTFDKNKLVILIGYLETTAKMLSKVGTIFVGDFLAKIHERLHCCEREISGHFCLFRTIFSHSSMHNVSNLPSNAPNEISIQFMSYESNLDLYWTNKGCWTPKSECRPCLGPKNSSRSSCYERRKKYRKVKSTHRNLQGVARSESPGITGSVYYGFFARGGLRPDFARFCSKSSKNGSSRGGARPIFPDPRGGGDRPPLPPLQGGSL